MLVKERSQPPFIWLEEVCDTSVGGWDALITDGWNVSCVSHKHYELSRNLVLGMCVVSSSYSEFSGSHCCYQS
jgi:hypothetical protein